MATLATHTAALLILDKVLESEGKSSEDVKLYHTTAGVGTNDQDEKIQAEVYFFGVGPDIYVVNLYKDGGEVQLMKASDSWSVFPPKYDEEVDGGSDN